MKKLLVSLIAVIAAVGTSMAADNNSGCKPKKVRVIHITAGQPDTMYGDSNFSTTVLDSDTVADYRIENYSEPEPLPTDSPRHYSGPESEYDGNWYVGGRVALHLMSWKNKYSGAPANFQFDSDADHDKYSFEPVFGWNLFAGYRFDPNWRMDLEFGHMTQFSDSDNGITFKLSTPYVMANAYYDFMSGFYLGLGAGAAFPRATLDWEYFTANSASKTQTSFMGAFMMGYSYRLSESTSLDFRYRLAGFNGPKWTRNVVPGVSDVNGVDLESLETKVGFIIDNSLSLGLRYEF